MSRRGYSLIEVLIVLPLVGLVMGAATVLLVRSTRHFKERADTADARIDVAIAAERLARDIRQAVDGAASTGELRLVHRDGSTVRWALEDGVLVRRSSRGEITCGTRIAAMNATVTPGGFVQVELEMNGGKQGHYRHAYVGASYRAIKGAD